MTEYAMTDEEAAAAEHEDFDWDDDVATFGDRLARAREAAAMTQAELARRLGVKLATIRNWEADRSEPRANRLQMLSGLLNVSIVWLMSGEGAGVSDSADNREAALGEILAELQDLRTVQTRLTDRTARLEERLRVLLVKA